MLKENENVRKAFLIEWYKILWNNARQSMDSIWKLIGPITLVGTVWVAMHKEFIPYNLGNSLVFIILFWAINITIDYNQWHRRNLIFFTAVERKFFHDEDYGRIIPSKYREPKQSWIGFYKICMLVFCTMLALAILISLTPFKGQVGWNMPFYERYDFAILVAGIILSINNYKSQEASAKKYIQELFKKNC